MSHFGDYIDGVPVKVSERYKRPPRIDLPYTVQDCLSRAHNFVNEVKYCTTFEKTVISKLKELRNLKETKKNERRHRLQLLEEAKLKKLDAIAVAEAEEKLKQLSVSEVSYPSTEEISAISPDERPNESCDLKQTPEKSPQKDELGNIHHKDNDNIAVCNNDKDTQLNILQPILVQSNYQLNNLLDDPDPLQRLKMNSKIAKIPQYHNVDTLTFKDFENDTSSPFDNVELKTINDMEQLAQVLQSQKDASTSCNNQQLYIPEQHYATIPNCSSQADLEGITYLPNAYVEQPILGSGVVYSPQQNYPNGYYIPPENICDNSIPLENSAYIHNYQYYIPTSQYPQTDMYYNDQLPINCDNSQLPNDTIYVPQPYFYYPQVATQYPAANSTPACTSTVPQTSGENQNYHQNKKSRSRSVPDIVKELNDELASVKNRINERSYNVSPAPKQVLQPTKSNKERRTSKHKTEQLLNPYDKMPPALQSMCQKIHGMGFPLDRVARVCSIVGENDKKVIEALLILGEIMDLGFSEGKACAVLAKNGFNKDKALDELVA